MCVCALRRAAADDEVERTIKHGGTASIREVRVLLSENCRSLAKGEMGSALPAPVKATKSEDKWRNN